MSGIARVPNGSIWVAIAAMALLVAPGCMVGDLVASNPAAVNSPAANDQAAQGIATLLKALQSDDSYERHRAVIALGRSGNPAALDPLIKALDDQDSFVRSFAANALGILKDNRALEPLKKALKDNSERVRRCAAEALGNLKNPAAVNSLAESLNDENVFVRRAAAEALGILQDPKAISPLIKALSDEDSFVRDGASNALTEIGAPGIPELTNALADWSIGPRAAQILHDLGWKPSSDSEKVRFDVALRNGKSLSQNWETVQRVLVSDANSGNAGQAENAAYALIGLGRTEALEELAAVLRTSGTPEMATVFLKSGNDRLADLARNWASEHSKEIQSTGDAGIVKWGSLQPN